MDLEDEELEFRFPPDWGSTILSWAQPRFESAFVLLHPFIRIPEDLWNYLEPEGGRWLEPEGLHELLQRSVQHVTWSDVMLKLNIPSYEVFVDIVNAHAIGLFALRAAPAAWVEALDAFLREEKIISPQTHYLPPTLKPQIKATLEEFGSGNPKWSESPYERENLLYATPYECAYSFICGARSTLEAIINKHGFEGFFAEPNTKFSWVAGGTDEPGASAGASAFRFDRDKNG